MSSADGSRVTREGSAYPPFIDGEYPSTSQPQTGGECMVFYPTLEEFRDFQSYMQKVEAAGAHLSCGVAKIVPPKEWTARPIRGHDYSDISELFIEGPIMQEVVGERGCYTQYNSTYKKRMKVQEFKKLANNPKFVKPKAFKDFLECEKYYWKHILYHRPVYGADFHASLYDNDDVDIWNINSLPSCLDILKEGNIVAPPAKEDPKKAKKEDKSGKDKKEKKLVISGVNNAFMYFGMWKASFAWHTEDMDLYSINYIHFGEPKFWYGISHLHRDKFDRLTEMLFPESKGQCKAFMRHKTHLVSPDLLQKHGIPYGTMVQKEGEIIITFPAGYHAGFNLGYNAAESTNFATDRWIEFGEKAVTCQCKNDSVRIYMGPFIKRFRPERWNQYKYWYEEPGQPILGIEEGKKNGKKKGANGSAAEVAEKADSSSSESPPPAPPPVDAVPSVRFFGDELKKEYENLWKWKPPNFMAEMIFNSNKSRLEPHCSLCQYFVPVALLGAPGTAVPSASRKIVSELAFARDPSSPTVVRAVEERAASAAAAAGSEGQAQHCLRTSIKEDALLSCKMCCVCVHASCYGETEAAFRAEKKSEWVCERCAYAGAQAVEIGALKCVFCPVTAGAMQMLDETHKDEAGLRQFAHILCTLFNHERAGFADEITKRPIILLPDKDKDGKGSGKGSEDGDGGGESPARNASTYYPDSDDPDTAVHEAEEVDPDEILPEPEPPKECSFCHGEDGVLVKCAHPECFPVNQFHVPCGRVTGVNYEARDFPTCLAAVCGQHDARAEGEGLSELNRGDQVVTWLESGADVQRGQIRRVKTDTFCVVDFDDGSFSSDLYPPDIASCECAAAGCNGAHHSGSRVRIRWTDGKQYFGTFRRAYKSRSYTVALFGTGRGLGASVEQGKEEVVECIRSELYGPNEFIPPQVTEKLELLEKREWKRKKDREQKRAKNARFRETDSSQTTESGHKPRRKRQKKEPSPNENGEPSKVED